LYLLPAQLFLENIPLIKLYFMETIELLFGHGDQLTWYQMSIRGIVIFFDTLIMLRITGQRTFGQKSTVDNVIIIILGAVLSRAVVGASPFVPVTITAFVIIVLHRLIATLCFHNKPFDKLINGSHYSLYANGTENSRNMKRTLISQDDVDEQVRIKMKSETKDNIKEIIFEKNGEVSMIQK
jgi:uncharacterized membrane protein YcaP (DUF421 family)